MKESDWQKIKEKLLRARPQSGFTNGDLRAEPMARKKIRNENHERSEWY